MVKELDLFLESLRQEAGESHFSVGISQEGTILSLGDGIAQITGLRDARLYELIQLEDGSEGIVFDLDRESIGVVMLTEKGQSRAGEKAYKTERIATIPVGESLLGRVVDPLGNPLDGKSPPEKTIPYPVERTAPPLIQRDNVNQPLYTGIKVIDAMLAIGRGQRELIIGDPATGKTSIGIDAIIRQKDSDIISIYVAIGQKKSNILKRVEEIRMYGDFSKTILLSADALSPVGFQYIAPYSGAAMAEYFLDRGKDVLIIYDDLTKHADAYRSLSLLLKRPPGREAYPGDIFFIHSRLLERSAKLHPGYGGGSITALPIVETQQGRISSYIPTNLISITDGQIYLDSALFDKGIRPAVDVGRSVSRIGGKAQVQAVKQVAERLKIDYSRFIEVEVFTKFGAHVEEETAKLIRRGERLREILKQPKLHPFSLEDQVLSFLMLESGKLDRLEITEVQDFCERLLVRLRQAFPIILERIRQEGKLSQEDADRLKKFILEVEEKE